MTRAVIRWRTGRDWRMALPGVLVLHSGLPKDKQRLIAALLLGVAAVSGSAWVGGGES